MYYQREQIQLALELPGFNGQAAQMGMVPVPRGNVRPPQMSGQARQGGVLVLIFEKNGQSHLLLTRRRDDLQQHAGQISFPGGRREEGESLRETALREAHEEVGIRPAEVQVLGELTPLYIMPSDFEVHPFVAWHTGQPAYTIQTDEVAEILEVPISFLLDPANRHEEPWEIRGFQLQVPFYLVGEHKVWGATAMMLSEFLERLRILYHSAGQPPL
jgi:8-oxo-dGTP pyrophosphatase MutT (NUDIX family)